MAAQALVEILVDLVAIHAVRNERRLLAIGAAKSCGRLGLADRGRGRAGLVDRYFAAQEPWALKKTDPARMATVLYVTAEVIRVVGISIQPFMPQSAEKLLDLVAVPADRRHFRISDAALVPGTELPKPQGIFPRYVEPETDA